MDENKNSTPESTPEENNINPAQPEANTAGPGEGKNKRSLRNTILTCISIALVLFAAIIVLRQYVYLPGQYEAPPTPAVTETPVATAGPTPYVKKIPVMMYFNRQGNKLPGRDGGHSALYRQQGQGGQGRGWQHGVHHGYGGFREGSRMAGCQRLPRGIRQRHIQRPMYPGKR